MHEAHVPALLPPAPSYLTLKPYTCQLFEPYASFLCRLLLIHRDLPRIILSSPQILPLLCSEVPRISPAMARILAIVLSTFLLSFYFIPHYCSLRSL